MGEGKNEVFMVFAIIWWWEAAPAKLIEWLLAFWLQHCLELGSLINSYPSNINKISIYHALVEKEFLPHLIKVAHIKLFSIEYPIYVWTTQKNSNYKTVKLPRLIFCEFLTYFNIKIHTFINGKVKVF